MREYMKCIVCGSMIPPTWARLITKNGDICMPCEGVEIDVWHVTLPGEKGGYYEHDPAIILDMIKDSDLGSGYTIIREKMKAVKYHNLEEFTGF